MTKLEYIAARIAFGNINADKIKLTVDSLLNEGVYSDDFIGIMDSKPARLDEVLPPFIAYLQHEGIPIPTIDDAVWQLIAHHVNRIASGEADPIEELQELISDVYWDYDFHPHTKKYKGDSHGIEYLVGLYWEYEESNHVVSPWKGNKLKRAIVKRSEEWMERFANKELSLK
jgi:hypothetical protein